MTTRKTDGNDYLVNRFLNCVYLFFLSLSFISCSSGDENPEVLWETIRFSQSGPIYEVKHFKSNLTYKVRPWYVMVSVNAPTLISICDQYVIYPPLAKSSGSKNLFLEASSVTCDLEISIFGKKSTLVLNPVAFGSMSDLWQYQIKKDGLLILFGSFYILFGILTLFVFLLKQTNFQYLAFSILLLLAGIYSVAIGNELFGMVFPSFPTEFWIPTLLGSLYLFPGALLWFLSYLLVTKWKKRFRNVGIGYLFLMSIILTILSILEIEFDSIVTPFHLICILFLIIFLPPLYLSLRNPKYNLTRVLFGLVFFLIFAFLEMGISYFTKNLDFPLLSFGLFCFLIPLGEFSIRRFFQLEAQIQNVKEIQNIRSDRRAETSKSRIANLNEEEVIEKLKDLIENQKIYLDEKLTLRKLANQLSIREDQVSYIINHKFKQTFFSYINFYRVEEAKILLKNRGVNILNIAFSVGFQSKSAFNSIFKKYTKMTPSEYQKKEYDNSI